MAVALHPEGVDRNLLKVTISIRYTLVALHPEGVDRNSTFNKPVYHKSVALHPEGVDRNIPVRC